MQRRPCFCGRAIRGYSKFCNQHHIADKRHGHPEQKGVTVTEVSPTIRHLTKWLAKHPAGKRIKATMTEAWLRLVADCRAERTALTRGQSWRIEAYEAVIKIADDGVNPERVAMMAAALAYLAADGPRRFRSDRAVRVQLSRRVRNLTTTHRAQAWNPREGRRKYWFKYLSPKAADFMGSLLMASLGRYGLAIHSKESAAEQQRREQQLETMRMIQNDGPIAA